MRRLTVATTARGADLEVLDVEGRPDRFPPAKDAIGVRGVPFGRLVHEEV